MSARILIWLAGFLAGAACALTFVYWLLADQKEYPWPTS